MAPGGREKSSTAPYAATLALTVTLAAACLLVAVSSLLLVIHPNLFHLQAVAGLVNQQSQSAKTGLYLLTFFCVLPLALILVPRLADTITARANERAFPVLAWSLAATLAAAVILIRLSAHLPWGDGLGVVLAVTGFWWVFAATVLARAARRRSWPVLLSLSNHSRTVAIIAAGLFFGTILCVTHVRGLRALPLALGAAAILAVLWIGERVMVPRVGRRLGIAIDLAVIVLLLFAIPDVVIFRTSSAVQNSVIFKTSSAIPNWLVEARVIQFQHDWILGPANQLLHGGALLVNDPGSQYGVGLVYFLAGWFHIAPIGYGTFGFLDAILTALFYVIGYGLLRLAGASRLLSASALALGVVALIYNLHYPVGALPEQGPLRFGMPMLLLLALVAAARWPAHARIARAAALVVIGVSSIWALEAFVYTVVTFVAITAIDGWLQPQGFRRRFAVRQLALAAGACVAAHLILAVGTLLGTGQLPHWDQYFAYLHGLLLGGLEGSITFGFDRWSPGLGVGAACLASAAAIVLLILREPGVVRRNRVRLIALTGATAYSIAVYSYFDNRSATYLLLYISLPLLVIGALWLGLLIRCQDHVPRDARVGSMALSLGVVVLLIVAAWPSVGDRFSRSALAHAYPGGGLPAALHRLWHPPPIDPRAPEGARLVARYLPGRRVVVILPAAQDLSIELLMRSGRANALFIGDGYMDSFVPSVWEPVIGKQIAELRPGQRVLIDRTAQAIIIALRAHPSEDPVRQPIDGGASQEEWALRRLDERFRLRPIFTDTQGFVVAELDARSG